MIAMFLAAAIAGRAAVIVMYNQKDFPEECLRPFGITAKHPDQFMSNLFDLSPPTVAEVVRDQRARLKIHHAPSMTAGHALPLRAV
jgi:hypothetical protein